MLFDTLFQNPPITYRLHPFWFWNGAMDRKEIARQIQQMAEKGIGGFFLCARQGLNIPYLSHEWFQYVAFALETAQQYGLHVWLYDEYPYPSGMSGGEVTLEHPEAKHRQLLHHTRIVDGSQPLLYELPWARVLSAQAIPLSASDETPLWSQAFDLSAYIGSIQSESVFQSTGLTAYTNKRFFTTHCQKQLVWHVPPGRWLITVFLEKEIENFKYFGTYVDPCDKAAVQTFLATTHERYAQHFQSQFGQTIKGLFTDEVGLLGRIPWSRHLPDAFRERYSYDLLENLPALLYAQEGRTARLRYQFFQCIHILLRETYHKQVSDWCNAHGLAYITEVPSVRMTTQRYSHVPGGDSAHEKIGRSLAWILNRYATHLREDPKIVSSLAHQLGCEHAAIECFHSIGWSMTLQDAKWMLDRLAAQGINFFVFHAFFYSISGLRKHDAPPSQFLQNPYWPHFRQLSDYAARLSSALSQGKASVSIAVIHPATTFWTRMGNPFQHFAYCGIDEAEARELEQLKRDWLSLRNQLSLRQIDYDHLDPELLLEASFQDGCLLLGEASYEVLILPPMTNLEAVAWSQIKAFLQAGGKVISVGLLPYEQIDQEASLEMELLAWFGLTESPRPHYWREADKKQMQDVADVLQPEKPHWTKGAHSAYFMPIKRNFRFSEAIEQVCALLHELLPPSLLLESLVGDTSSLLMQQRSLPDTSQLVFIAHQEGAEKVFRLHIRHYPDGCIVKRLDLSSGATVAFPVEKDDDGWRILLPFAPYESYLLHISLPEEIQRPEQHQHPLWQLSLDIQQPWQLTTSQNNLLRFGSFHFALDLEQVGKQNRWYEGEAGETWPVLEVKPFINQSVEIASTQTFPMHFKQLFGLPVQGALAYPLHCWYQTSWFVEEIPSSCHLLMDEDAIGGIYVLYLNGQQVPLEDFVSVSPYNYQQKSVQSLLKPGKNTLVIDLEVQRDADGVRDPLYLSGPFGVTFDPVNGPTLGLAPATGIPQSGVQQGYPYFAGTLCFTREIVLDALPHEEFFALVLQGWNTYLHDCVEILVNGFSLGTCCWSPYHWEGPCEIFHLGKNTFEVRVTNTLSGMLEGTYFDERSHQVVPVHTPPTKI